MSQATTFIKNILLLFSVISFTLFFQEGKAQIVFEYTIFGDRTESQFVIYGDEILTGLEIDDYSDYGFTCYNYFTNVTFVSLERTLVDVVQAYIDVLSIDEGPLTPDQYVDAVNDELEIMMFSITGFISEIA